MCELHLDGVSAYGSIFVSFIQFVSMCVQFLRCELRVSVTRFNCSLHCPASPVLPTLQQPPRTRTIREQTNRLHSSPLHSRHQPRHRYAGTGHSGWPRPAAESRSFERSPHSDRSPLCVWMHAVDIVCAHRSVTRVLTIIPSIETHRRRLPVLCSLRCFSAARLLPHHEFRSSRECRVGFADGSCGICSSW